MPERVRVCPRDHEPVVFTLEFPGAEHFCVICGWKGDVFAGTQVDATPELLDRYAELSDRYEVERAERTGRPIPRKEPEGPRPTCGGCGKTAEGPMDGNKPHHWYSRTIDGVTDFACSRECIREGAVAPW